ncbi:Vitamin B12 import ATP-binding protein BtuD [Streptomyces tendae]
MQHAGRSDTSSDPHRADARRDARSTTGRRARAARREPRRDVRACTVRPPLRVPDRPARRRRRPLGANGAGKTTLLRAVSGTLRLHRGAITAGRVRYGDTVLDGRDPVAAVRAGVVQVPEGRRVFAGRTVDENLRAGGLGLNRRAPAQVREARERVFTLFPRLAERTRQAAGLLSGGEQQMLAIGRALMAAPRLLLLDEPSLGLAPMMVERIAEVVREINAQGTAVLLVEQNAGMALSLAGQAHVLEVGEIRLSGDAADLARTDAVRRLYLGETGDDTEGKGAA